MRDGSVFDTLETMGLMNGAHNGAHAEDVAQAPVAEPEVLAMAPQVDYVPFADLPVLDRLRTAD